jgi:hypothetical protein
MLLEEESESGTNQRSAERKQQQGTHVLYIIKKKKRGEGMEGMMTLMSWMSRPN